MSGAQIMRFPDRTTDGQRWEPWIDETALARHFGVHARTVRRWRVAGMPSSLFGGVRRYRISEAEQWHSTKETA